MARLTPSNLQPDASLIYRRHLAKLLGSFKRSSGKRNSPITGIINHAGGSSSIVITRFTHPLLIPPSIDCSEPWIRRNYDWHYEPHNSRFCWVLSEEWKEHFNQRKNRGENQTTLCHDAAIWTVKAMEYVLTRHWTGYEYGIVDWPSEWEAYSHGKEGVTEFREGLYET